MTREIISSVIAVHGIIHLIGFVKEWKLGPVGNFSGRTLIPFSESTSRLVGISWLVTCILLLASTLAYYFSKDWFWIVGIAGVGISQTLIIIYWHDAKWGTLLNVLVMATVILAAGRVGFEKMIRREVNNLLASSSADRRMITGEDIVVLPGNVQNWLKKSHVIGKTIPKAVHVIQKGSMRTDPGGDWMQFDAGQYFTIDPPGFVWNATIHTGNFIDIVGRDKYENGTGNMLIKAASLVPIANSSGREIDQGTLIRFMAEMVWFPHAAVSEYLDWEEVDHTRARVTMSYQDVTASGVYTFNDDGLPVSFEAERYGEFDGKFSKETWSVTTTRYGSFDGLSIGNASEVTWKLKDGDFTWLKLSIVSIEYTQE